MPTPRAPRLVTHGHQPSWRLAGDTVEALVTRLGGQLAPVSFALGRGRKVQPYFVAPWSGRRLAAGSPPLMRVLRGDFFCLPFGHSADPRPGKKHPIHGETCNRSWSLRALTTRAGGACLEAEMRLRARPGVVTKRIEVRPGQAAVFSEHRTVGLAGPMTPGHHPTLSLPGPCLLSTSGFSVGQVRTPAAGDPADKSYSILRDGAVFQDLRRAPALHGPEVDLTRQPAQPGYVDIVQLATLPRAPFAWSALVCPGERYVWFSLKDASVLTSTLLWMNHGGRHATPWDGISGVLGFEEITSYFDLGIATSMAPNPIANAGAATHVDIDPGQGLVVRFVQAAAAVPAGFGAVEAIEPDGPGRLVISSGQQRVRVRLDWEFIGDGLPA